MREADSRVGGHHNSYFYVSDYHEGRGRLFLSQQVLSRLARSEDLDSSLGNPINPISTKQQTAERQRLRQEAATETETLTAASPRTARYACRRW